MLATSQEGKDEMTKKFRRVIKFQKQNLCDNKAAKLENFPVRRFFLNPFEDTSLWLLMLMAIRGSK